MSSARKRGAIQKANNETDWLRQQLMLSQHHGAVMRLAAETLAKDADRYRWLRDRLQVRYEASIAGGDKRAMLTMRVWHGFFDSKIRPEYGWTDLRYFDECCQKVDAAIDAAIESYNA